MINPDQMFQGNIVFTVPHMDDGVLACGGTIARLTKKKRLHIIYATDGTASPEPVLPWIDSVSEDLGNVRIREAKAAMGSLGVPEGNIQFLGFPDGRLKRHLGKLTKKIEQLLETVNPDHIFVPFRFDGHSDHLALNRAVTELRRENAFKFHQYEYFVYYRYRLLPEKDIRKYIKPQYLIEVNLAQVSEKKRAALDYFKSQTTKYFHWQTRPNLAAWLLNKYSKRPEIFLQYDCKAPGTAVFKNSAGYIRLAHRLEPFIKKKKDFLVAVLQRGWAAMSRNAN
jgi:LmbE family N-acetylglucosaminyl deacetylase